MIKNFEEIMTANSQLEPKTIAVVAPADLDLLRVISEAEKQAMAKFILVGDEKATKELIKTNSLTIAATIIDVADEKMAASRAVEMVHQQQAQVIMKGMIHSSDFLRPILNKETGLNTGKRVSNVAIFEDDGKLRLITDVAVTVDPDLQTKKELIENAVWLAHKLGNTLPKVAVLASIEVINPVMQDTVDAAILTQMNHRGQIKDCLVDGPLAYDNATSIKAAQQKAIASEVAGQADILLVPTLTAGNVLSKALVHTAKKRQISATVGAGVPLVFTSRSESMEGKLLSIALAAYVS